MPGIFSQLAAGFPKPLDPPKDDMGKSLGSDLEARAPGQFGIPSDKGKLLIDACIAKSAANADVAVVYCSDLTENGQSTNCGYAYPKSDGAGSYSNWAFVAGKSIGNTEITLGHEVGHLLTDAAHFGTDYPRTPMPGNQLVPLNTLRIRNNLMRAGDPDGMPGIAVAVVSNRFRKT